MTLNIFNEDGVLFMFFVYVILITGHTVWGVIQHWVATPMSMNALFFVTIIEVWILSNLSGWRFIHLITNKEVTQDE